MISWWMGGAWIGAGGGAGESERIEGDGERRVSRVWVM